MFFAGFIWLPEFMKHVLYRHHLEITHCIFMEVEAVVGLGGVIQYEMQDILWERKSLWGSEKPTGKPIPAKQFFSHQLLSAYKLTSLSPGGYKICST